MLDQIEEDRWLDSAVHEYCLTLAATARRAWKQAPAAGEEEGVRSKVLDGALAEIRAVKSVAYRHDKVCTTISES